MQLSTEFLADVTHCAPADALVIIDEAGTILFANPQVGHLLGYALGELPGQIVEVLLPVRFRLPHIGHRLRFTDDRRVRPMSEGQLLFILRKDGSECPVKIGLRPIRRGLETLVVATIHHVTEESERN